MASTKVKISGFELQTSKEIPMSDFYQQLEELNKKSDFQVGNYSVRIFTRIIENLAVGLILTFKGDKKKLATETDDNGKLKVNRVELEEHQTSTEASLFCFNPSSQRGVFTHYAGAASISIYSTIFNQAHKAVKDLHVTQMVNEKTRFGSIGSKKRSRDKIIKEMEGAFLFKYIYQENDLKAILENLKSISEIEVTSELNVPEEKSFLSLLSATKKTTQTVTFLEKFRPIENIRGLLSNFVADTLQVKDKNYALKLIGQSLAGSKAQYWIGDNTKEYGFFDYDDYIEVLPEEVWESYIECDALSHLIEIVKQDKCGSFGEVFSIESWGKCNSASDSKPTPDLKTPNSELLKKNEGKDLDNTPLQVEMIL